MAKSEYNGVTVSHFAQSIEARARNGMGEDTGMRHEAQLASNGLASPGVKDAIKDAVGVQTPAVEGTNSGPIQTMRMPRRARWVPGGLLASVNEVVVPVAPPPIYQVQLILVLQLDSALWILYFPPSAYCLAEVEF